MSKVIALPRFGRRPRKWDPRVPHFSALKMGAKLPTAPASIDYTAKLPARLGVFDNDQLGDCTIAGLYAALEVWTANTQSTCDVEPDSNAVQAYSEACGYVPGDPSTDQGGVEQDVLTYAMLAGLPVGASGGQRHRIAAFVEVDPTNVADVKLAVYLAGLAYIGFQVPEGLSTTPGSTWDVQAGQQLTDEGHCVIVAGYDSSSGLLKIVSWGAIYYATLGFWSACVDEAYMLSDPDWFNTQGVAPPGLALPDLETQMWALREPDQQEAA